jgi:gliding motility-associated-like protein
MNQRYLLFCLLLLPFWAAAIPENRSLEFIANQGQWDGPFLYKAGNDMSNVYLQEKGFIYTFGAQDNIDKIRGLKNGKVPGPVTLKFHTYKVSFIGANIPQIFGSKQQSHYYNYFLGGNPSRWKSGIHPNLAVDYKNVYSNIDLHVASDEKGMKYDFIVNPGADPSKIILSYEGQDDLIIKNNKLVVRTSVGDIEELVPFAYQYREGERVEVKCRYKVKANIVTYSFPDGYNKEQTLVIDPTVVFASYSKSGYDNWGYTATYDASGNFYAGGITGPAQGGTGFNITPGAFQTKYGGPNSGGSGNGYPSDMAIMKFDSSGKNFLFGTYLGGNDNEQPHSMIVDPAGNLIIAGRSYSTDFPTTAGCYDNSLNGSGDLVIAKLNSNGTALLASTFIGGSGEDVCNFTPVEFGWGNLKHNYGDDARSEVNVDRQGNIYVAGCTQSTNFPTTSNAIKTTLGSGDLQDGVVLKMNSSLTSLIWSTYLGGSGDDAAYVLTLDTSETQIYVAGGTMSSNFPSTSGVWHSSYLGGVCDGFLCRFQNGGTYAVQKSSFIGANGYDQVYGVQMDYDNNVYVMGQTMGGNYPTTAGVYKNANSSQFVTKLDHDITAPIASTVFGTGVSDSTNISPVAFLVDTCQNVYISGWGGNIFPSTPPGVPPGTGNTKGLPITANAAQSTTDGTDFYFIVLSKNLLALQYATFMGGNGLIEHVDGGTSRFDKNGVVYQAICGGCGGSSGFPTTAGAYSQTNGSTNCNLIALKIAFNFGAVKTHAAASPNKTICLGDPITFSSAGTANAVTYEWNFGDGSPLNTNANPTYTYTSTGTFQVRLIGINPNACKVRDTAYLTIKVDTNTIKPDFVVDVLDSCFSYKINLTNTSKYGTPASGTSFFWTFGDGNTSALPNPGNYTYQNKGTYTITLTESDPNACNSPDSVKKIVSFNSFFVKSGFKYADVCYGDTAFFTNTSGNATSYKWFVGDSVFKTTDPYYRFDSAGTYKVKLVAYNDKSCNKADSVEQTITVNPKPIADFLVTYDHPIPEVNDSVHFNNRSQKADSYNWDFGDKYGSQESNPVHFYKRTGDYYVCLQSSNKYGCSDTACKKVHSDVLPLADLPTGFSPNGDGNNDILYVRGAAIESLNLKIFNRWGQLVFESNSQKDGWDGTYKGKPQEMDAYGFVLNVVFIDETTLHKQGNVTLLR